MNQTEDQPTETPQPGQVASQQPLVSVLMSVYNAGEYLRPAVLSILAQSYRNLELIIIDDGCTDGCLETISDIKDERIVRLAQENQGKAVALNYALTVARGEFFAIQDADDLSYPRRVELQVRCMVDNPDVAAVFTGSDLIYQGIRVAPAFPGRDRAECAALIEAFRLPALDPTAMYCRQACSDLEFAPELRVAQVYDYVLRVGERHPVLVLGTCLYSYRFHWGSITKRSPEVRELCLAEVYRRACARRGIGRVEPRRQMQAVRGRFSNSARDNNLASAYTDSVLFLRSCDQNALSVRTGFHCISHHPWDLHYHKALLYSIVPTGMLGLMRRLWHKKQGL